ncbi:hypothetical protein FJ250_01790 [bacterium]|nr:hypothetical protein [bacterium]
MRTQAASRLSIAAIVALPLAAVAAVVPGVPFAARLGALGTAALIGSVWAARAAGARGRELARLRRQTARLKRQLEASAALRRAQSAAPSSRVLSRSVLQLLGGCCGARAGAFYLMRGGQILELAAQTGSGWAGDPAARLRVGDGLAGRAAACRRRLVEPAAPAGTLVAVPYRLAGRVKGAAVYLFGEEPGAEALELLDDTAEQVATALDARRSRERIQLLLGETRRQTAAYAAQQRVLQRTNVRLQRSDRYKNEFLANMTHELRSPLNSMLLLSQVLAENRHGRLAADEVDAAQVINKAGRELLVIIDDILDLTKAEAGRLELHPETVRVADLAESLTALYRPLAGRRGLDLQVVVEPGTPAECVTDPTRLGQILKNLLNNALKFTERGGVSLHIARAAPPGTDPPALEFVVADTGIGIDTEVLPALFAPFTQGDGSIARRFGGSGLGLSICRKLAHLLGARIEVASEVGRGSTFRLRLPVSMPGPDGVVGAADVHGPGLAVAAAVPPPAPPAAPRPDAVPRSGELTGRQVLIVDDDMRAVYRLAGILESSGAHVRVARDAAAGLLALETAPPPDLALVGPQALRARGETGCWQRRAAAVGARLAVVSSTSLAAAARTTLPALDPDLPTDQLAPALARLFRAHAAAPAARPEVSPC